MLIMRARMAGSAGDVVPARHESVLVRSRNSRSLREHALIQSVTRLVMGSTNSPLYVFIMKRSAAHGAPQRLISADVCLTLHVIYRQHS